MPATAKPSSPAKAGDPVIRSASDGIEKPRRTGYPACAGYDDCGSGGGPATFPVVAAFAGTTVELPPLPALSRGEGRGEGLSPRARFAESPPHPKFAIANFDLSPQAGRGAPNAQQRSVTSPSPRSSRGEGRGEGLSPRARFAERAPHPKFAFANFDLSPQAGRGAPRAWPASSVE